MSEYTEQAEKFCRDTGTTLEFERLHEVPGDERNPRGPLRRWKYLITVSRAGRRSWSTKFTTSAWNVNDDAAKIRRAKQAAIPTAYDFLACIQKSDPDTFESFCGECGYSDDSRKALETYLSVQAEWSNVIRTWSDVLEQLQEIN